MASSEFMKNWHGQQGMSDLSMIKTTGPIVSNMKMVGAETECDDSIGACHAESPPVWLGSVKRCVFGPGIYACTLLLHWKVQDEIAL